MIRRRRPHAAALALAAAGAAAGCSGSPGADERSVILVTLDTTRADRIGAFGGTGGLSPSIDRVAAEGAVFEEAISQAPLTLPAHASLMTGRYPASHGVRHNGIHRLPESETTLAERLREGGWETAAFVAAFVLNRGFGIDQGFEVYDDIRGGRYEEGRDRIYEAQRSAGAVNAAVVSWLDGRADPGRKLFLWVHYYDPHEPYAPPERAAGALRGAGYDREISYMDAALGDLLARLRRDGLLDRSVLVIAGDHGESLGEHGELTHGIFLYEASVRVPLVVRAPGTIRPGTRVSGPVELVDVAPTVLELCGAPPLSNAQGRSLLPRIDGDETGAGAVAHAESLMPRLEFGWSELRMVRDGRFKYVQAPRPELYDLRADPREIGNLAAGEPTRADEMRRVLEAWTRRTEDAGAAKAAEHRLDPDEEAKLRSLGYLGGGAASGGAGAGAAVTDPKDGILQMRRLDAAREKLAAGDAAAALSEVDRVLTDDPENHQARATRVLALIEGRRLAEAEREAIAALAAAEGDPGASPALVAKSRALLASVLRLEGKLGEAESQYRRLLEADAANDPAATDLARLLLDTGRVGEAEQLVRGVLARDPRNGMALATSFLLAGRRGDRAGALAAAEALAEARAGDPGTLALAGGVLVEAGKPASGAACYEAALERAGVPDPGLLGALGSARLQAGNASGAEEAFTTAARLAPRDPRPHHYLGTIALGRGDEATAKRHFDRALAADPRFVAPLAAYARWLAAKGRRDEALVLAREAMRRNPGDPRAIETLERLRRSSPPAP